MNNIIIEICCGSTEDAISAWKGGAKRVELNSNLFHGGLTPTLGSLVAVKKHCPDLKVMCMSRPREGGFCYTDLEFETMLEDARLMLSHGADGIVFGILNPDGTIDKERCKKMMEVIGDKESVFHRAIDVVPDWKETLDILIELGVKRVLTSGQKPSVPEGIKTIKAMIEYSNGRIEILPGAGITSDNADWVVRETGTNQMHAAIHRIAYDRSCEGNTSIFFGGCIYPPEDRYSVTHQEDIKEFLETVNN